MNRVNRRLLRHHCSKACGKAKQKPAPLTRSKLPQFLADIGGRPFGPGRFERPRFTATASSSFAGQVWRSTNWTRMEPRRTTTNPTYSYKALAPQPGGESICRGPEGRRIVGTRVFQPESVTVGHSRDGYSCYGTVLAFSFSRSQMDAKGSATKSEATLS